MRRLTVIAAGAAACAALAACSSSSGSGSSASASGSASSSASITVFAAASLTGAFTQLGKQFEAAHPGDKVTFSFGPSSGLATQIISGAPADVFASAAPANMQQVVSAGDASSPQNFAKNIMEVAVPLSNPAHVKSVDNLAKSSVKVALCQPQVPCGLTAGSKVKGIKIPAADNASTTYPSATVSKSGHASAAQAFVAYVLSPAGQSALTAAGF